MPYYLYDPQEGTEWPYYAPTSGWTTKPPQPEHMFPSREQAEALANDLKHFWPYLQIHEHGVEPEPAPTQPKVEPDPTPPQHEVEPTPAQHQTIYIGLIIGSEDMVRYGTKEEVERWAMMYNTAEVYMGELTLFTKTVTFTPAIITKRN